MTTPGPSAVAGQLAALAAALRIQLLEAPKPELGLPVKAGVGPPLPSLELVEILQGDVDLTTRVEPLTYLSKEVLYREARPENPRESDTPTVPDDLTTFRNLGATDTATRRIVGGLPSLADTTEATGILSQLSGLVAKLTGTIPFPVSTTLPVALRMAWEVAPTKDGTTVFKPGTDFAAPDGLEGQQAGFLLPPRFDEDGAPAATSWWLRGTAQLSAGTETASKGLPPVEVPVPRIPLAPLVLERFRVSGPTAPVDAGMPAGASVQETGVENLLSRLEKAFPQISVALDYTILKDGQTVGDGELFGPDGKPFSKSGSIAPGSPLTFFVKPVLARPASSPVQFGYAIRIRATVSGLPGATKPLTVTLPDVPFAQVALAVPELMLAFGGKRYGPAVGQNQATYVFLSPGNPALANGYVDARTAPDAVAAVKQALLLQLTAFRDGYARAVEVFKKAFKETVDIFDAVLDDTDLNVFTAAFDALAGSAVPNDVVVEVSSAVRDIGAGPRDARWNDWISSLVFVGVPKSRRLRLWADPDWKGASVSFGVPERVFVADYTTLHGSWLHECNKPAAEYDNEKGPDFGNVVTSSAWE